jgi:Tol biopolymer transport system component
MLRDVSFNNQLWMLDIKDKNKVQLTKSGFNAWGEFSPDGRKIAFTSERTGNADIWLVVWEKKFRFGLWE